MNRIASSRTLGSFTHTCIPKHGRVAGGTRNLSTGLRPFILNVPFRVSCGRIASHSSIRNIASLARVSEEDVFTFDASPARSDETPQPSENWVRIRSSSVGHDASVGKFWLRENCQCSQCIHPDTKQRNVDTFSIPENVNAKKLDYHKYKLKVQWSDGHKGIYPYTWIATHTHKKINRKSMGSPLRFREYQTHHPINNTRYPTVDYGAVMSGNEGLLEWLENIYSWGFCFVEGVPINPKSTEALLKRIAFIRHTHYGGFWDFTADLTFKDTAYTTEFLGAHTDNTYFTDPARLQLFHLLSHTDGDGGASLLVDGFRAAETLLKENRNHATSLMTTKHPFHASGNEDTCITPAEHYPVLSTHQYLRELYQIRWNNYDRAPKRDWWFEEQDRWYAAARHFNEIIRRPDMEIWTQLKPGTALIFDNWRMMHGRSEYTGKRRMCGGYINNDDFISRYRLSKFGRETLLQHLGNTQRNPGNPYRYI